jgi:hypothetical protein
MSEMFKAGVHKVARVRGSERAGRLVVVPSVPSDSGSGSGSGTASKTREKGKGLRI